MFTSRPQQPLIDQVVESWYVSTCSESGFVTGLGDVESRVNQVLDS